MPSPILDLALWRIDNIDLTIHGYEAEILGKCEILIVQLIVSTLYIFYVIPIPEYSNSKFDITGSHLD